MSFHVNSFSAFPVMDHRGAADSPVRNLPLKLPAISLLSAHRYDKISAGDEFIIVPPINAASKPQSIRTYSYVANHIADLP